MDLDRFLVAVLFPGIVKNDEKALECLGGIRNISQVHSKPNKRLGLTYQPGNPYVRKIYSEPRATAGLLLKVKIKKSKVNNQVKKDVVSTDIIGRVNKLYKYESLCEFQYLPVQRDDPQEAGDSPLKCILDDIMPSGLDTIDFLSKPGPLFIVPSVFTRLDRCVLYSYTEKKTVSRALLEGETDDDYHRKKRAERSIPMNRFSFNLTDDIPSGPTEYCLEQKRMKLEVIPDMEEEYQTIVRLFEKAPIWSTNLIKFHTKLKIISLKLFLPCVAYYMRDGPWRSSWVKYGYDPRKEPEARKYQILDFRLRHTDGIHSMVQHEQVAPVNKKGENVRTIKKRKEKTRYYGSDALTENHVYFKPGVPPPRRQIFYRFCDVKLPVVEEILSSDPPPGYMCHEKHGWLPPNAGDIVREHIFKCVKEAVISHHLKDQDGSDDDIYSDDETASTSQSEVKSELDFE